MIKSIQKYANGQIKEMGSVKRSGFMIYERTGKWVEYHPNGQMAGEGMYEAGEKVEATWEYWEMTEKPNEATTGG